MTDEIWADYLDKLKRFEVAVKLVSFHTQEAAKYASLTAFHTREVVDGTRKYLDNLSKKKNDIGQCRGC